MDSILAQTCPGLEIILVDDGSRDGSGRICDEYAAKDTRIRVIHKENGGLSSARNTGIDAATGEYLTFVDSDDWIEPDSYGPMLALMEQYGAQLVCAGRYDINGRTGERKIGLCPRKEECITAEEMVGRIFLWDGCDSSACDKLFHHSLFDAFRFPDGKVSEDVATTYKIVLKAERAVMWDKPIYNYYHRPGSISTAKAITEKTFHFSQHTAVIYPYIQENHPKIEPQAAYLRVRALSHILLLLDQADSETRETFWQEYCSGRKNLRKFAGFILKSKYFGKKERITDILLILGLYRLLRPIFHR